jgi:hypothetical protein
MWKTISMDIYKMFNDLLVQIFVGSMFSNINKFGQPIFCEKMNEKRFLKERKR